MRSARLANGCIAASKAYIPVAVGQTVRESGELLFRTAGATLVGRSGNEEIYTLEAGIYRMSVE